MQAAAGEQQTTTTRRHEHKTAVQGSLVDHLAGAPDCPTSNYYGGGVPRLCLCGRSWCVEQQSFESGVTLGAPHGKWHSRGRDGDCGSGNYTLHFIGFEGDYGTFGM